MTARIDTNWSYNGLTALVMDNGLLRVSLLPELGGKLFQITLLRTGRDLLWHNPRLTVRSVPFGVGYDDVFFGGWDELFPNDVAEELAGEPYPDHGELWASPWAWQVTQDGPEAVEVTLTLQTPISDCHVTKVVRLRSGECRLDVAWTIENRSGRDLPFLWKQHVALPTSEPATVTMGARTVEIDGFGEPRAGGAGTRYEWPYLDVDGVRHDMRRTLPGSSGVTEFQYGVELDGGWCAVTYDDGTGLGLAFDPEIFRSCWIFASYGGWRGHEVLVLEPCTGYPVSVADGLAAGTHRVLAAGEVVSTELAMVCYEGMADVSRVHADGRVEGGAA